MPDQDSKDQSSGSTNGSVTRRPGPWAAAIFELEDMYTGIPGWLPQEIVSRESAAGERTSGEHLEPVTWNGWDCPHFERAGGDLIVRQHNKRVQRHTREAGRVYPEDLLAGFDTASNSYRFFMIDGYDQDEGRYSGEWETYGGVTVEVEPGYRLELYPIGAWGWIWERADNQG